MITPSQLVVLTYAGALCTSKRVFVGRYTGVRHSSPFLSTLNCTGIATAQCSDGDLRLVGGAVPYEGRVEVCYQNSWGTICDNSWSSADAKVVCRQLNFTSFGNECDKTLHVPHHFWVRAELP